jgi:hypothetical protein
VVVGSALRVNVGKRVGVSVGSALGVKVGESAGLSARGFVMMSLSMATVPF